MDQSRWQKVEQLYNAALELPADEREAFVAERAADDDELRQEVISLLNSAETDDSFLAAPEFDLGIKLIGKDQHVLKKGQEFGRYRILSLLGRGGMGEVYLAEDTRLGRKIALKVLPQDLAADDERIRRFVQEARSASALNHPNILTIHEIGEADGWHFIASEYVDGPTLRDRLKVGPVPLDEGLRLATQVATALSAAHGAGIVHRDIKPENIMIRPDGLVKVLDFGLAKLTENVGGSIGVTNMVTTTPGMVMGTVAYMSPEQTRGHAVDARSDIWSLGVVLFEMVTGKLPFGGDTSSDMIAAILTADPRLPEGLSGDSNSVWRVIAKALKKQPSERYQSVRDLAADLQNVDPENASPTFVDNPTLDAYRVAPDTDSRVLNTADAFREQATGVLGQRTASLGPRLALIAAGIAVLALGGGYLAYRSIDSSRWFAPGPIKIARVFDSGKTTNAAISPDGKYIAHVQQDAGQQSLWNKHLATNSNLQLVSPDRTELYGITFSKDGNYIYYVKGAPGGTLYKVPVLGGDSKKVFEGVDTPVSFSPDEQQFAYLKLISDTDTRLMIADVTSGSTTVLATREGKDVFGGPEPAWSPDGRTLAVPVWENKLMNIALVPVDGGEVKLLLSQKWREVLQVQWMPDGSSLIGAASAADGPENQIWKFPVAGGDAIPVTADLNNYMGVSLNSDASKLLTIQWKNQTNIWRITGGRMEAATAISENIHAQYQFITLAPDGRVVFPSNENASGDRDIWIMNADGTGGKQLTSSGANILPCVTADGRYIVFTSNRNGGVYHLWRMNLDGNDVVQLTRGEGERGPRCAPDGRTVYYMSGGPETAFEANRIWKTTIDGAEPVQVTDYPSGGPDVSPDGKWLAFRFKPLTAPTTAPLQLRIISVDGGAPDKTFNVNLNRSLWVRWRPDGSSVTFRRFAESGAANIWEQPIDGSPARPVTRFTSDWINGFEWARNGDLICARGRETRDPILISDF